MQSTSAFDQGSVPCLQIQVDLSAMIDGELDAPSVRRVMVHSDVCAACRGFLQGIRQQVRLHKTLHEEGVLGDRVGSGAARLRRQLMENRQKLARILYELGRGFVLMGLSPDFSREVAKEPVPVPDLALRGRTLVDEVQRWVKDGDSVFSASNGVGTHGVGTNGAGTNGAGTNGAASDAAIGVPDARDTAPGGAPGLAPGALPSEWVTAKQLFDQEQLRTPTENLAKGQRLLTECLLLQPSHDEARIYLGLVHHVRGQRTLARRQFAEVLAGTDDRVMRGYALLNLGNVHIDEGDCDGAIELLLQLVDSGVIEQQPRLGMAYFNLGLAYGLLGQFERSLEWFGRLHDELPHKRGAIARELGRRIQFVHLLRSRPEIERRFAASFPCWFPLHAKEAG